MDIEAFRKAGYGAIDAICEYYNSIESFPVMAQVEPGFLRDSLPEEAPEKGEEWNLIAKDYQEKVLPGITHWQHPNFHAYFPGNTTFEGMLADLHASAISNPGFNWSVSPSVTELELITLDWTAKMFGLSEEFHTTSAQGGSIILSSASEIAITVAVAAREKILAQMIEKNASAETTMEEITFWKGIATSKMIIYGSTQTHSIGIKAAMILGLQFRAIEVTKKDGFALRGEALTKALEDDQAKGLIPFMLIGTVGTTSSGAVDRLDEIEEVLKNYPDIWFHIDAAYAGVCLALPEMRTKCHLDVINRRVNSFSTNLHKWGLITLECSTLYVRNRVDLSNALTVTPQFLRSKQGDANSALDLRNMQLSLGRRFRSLKLWFTLRSYGQEGFRQHLRKGIALSQIFNKLIETQQAPLKIVAPPQWSLTVFRLEPVGMTDAQQLDTLNRRFWEELQTRNDAILLTQTTLPEIGFCVRFVCGTPSARMVHIEKAYAIICQIALKVLQDAQ
ncbi:PLP-dependent transferase [Meira miltonrushii]|uniref:PLP-dependent transferase n=1 Tax=Meira miltonrushii TaxID=1280837 RepID=A0A316VII5_9BASI|nr:PLP-dependent transferase [Meira miltonrushii]PWN36858.1 PLP-dependent transferase [Meira miltonrushii]